MTAWVDFPVGAARRLKRRRYWIVWIIMGGCRHQGSHIAIQVATGDTLRAQKMASKQVWCTQVSFPSVPGLINCFLT